MAPLLFLILFVFTRVPGNNCLRTLEKITAQTGRSVTIPCFYDQKYKDHVKYWCKGEMWNYCTIMVRTDSPQSKGEVSITDDRDQLVFNVTMRNLQQKDSDLYWCAVEIGGILTVDDGASVLLTVTTGVQSVWTESWTLAERGASVTIPCHYDQKYKHHVKYWCKGYHWKSCITMVRTDSPQSEGEVSITDDRDQLVFNVTMRNLQQKDSDWYWCAVEIDRGPDDGVILSLTVRKAESVTSSDQQGADGTVTTGHERILTVTVSPADLSTLNVTNEKNNITDFSCTSSVESQSSSTLLVSLVILGVLLMPLTVVMVIWILQSRRKETETRNRGTGIKVTVTTDREEVNYTIAHEKPAEENKVNKSSTQTADVLVYSSVIKKKRSSEDPGDGKN